MINHQNFPEKKTFCDKCLGKRNLWSREIAKSYNPCPQCEGKGYIILDENSIRPPVTEQVSSRMIHVQFESKNNENVEVRRRGRPSKK